MRNCERVADRVTLIAPPLWDARSNRQLPRGQTESAAIGQSPCANSTGCRRAKALPRRWKSLLQSPAGVPQLREALGSNVSGRLLRDPPGGGGPCGARRDAIPRMRHLIPDLSFAERHQREFASHRLDLLDVGLGSFDGVARASLEDLSSDSALRYRASKLRQSPDLRRPCLPPAPRRPRLRQHISTKHQPVSLDASCVLTIPAGIVRLRNQSINLPDRLGPGVRR